MLGIVSQIRVSGGNRTHDPHANSLAYYPLDYQGTLLRLTPVKYKYTADVFTY